MAIVIAADRYTGVVTLAKREVVFANPMDWRTGIGSRHVRGAFAEWMGSGTRWRRRGGGRRILGELAGERGSEN